MIGGRYETGDGYKTRESIWSSLTKSLYEHNQGDSGDGTDTKNEF